MLLIRCHTNQLDDYYKNSINENDTLEESVGILQFDGVYNNITLRIEKAIQQIIPTNPELKLNDTLMIELISNGLDNFNRTMVSINIVISVPGYYWKMHIVPCTLMDIRHILL